MAATASAIILGTLIAMPAFAADAAAEEGGLSDIIVTAQKRPENLQATPISISVLRGDDLVNRHVTSLLDLGDGANPSLNISPFYSRGSALIVNIGGIGVVCEAFRDLLKRLGRRPSLRLCSVRPGNEGIYLV